ncbi:helix-turn-helix domain-containing protein [Moraxella nasovis]|uniref:helix-turn-helix domain-containing protein n=1 Tax=Moraxella nasovis TaxID=2904121 RepID=UPI001F61E0A5|nr:helix-turn-helix domain-containing protein [Moraxella nasovis]UNU74137.1 helix-turn-helix domain-containing protein [Moraxella nasovis]
MQKHRTKKPTKKQMILEHLLSGRTLTQLECTNLYHCTRLSSAIHELRKAGHDIETIKCKNTESDGTHGKYRYIGVAS